MNQGNERPNRTAGVERDPPLVHVPPAVPPSDAFCQHFFRCFFCRIGDRYTDDHFCEPGRELLVAMLDEKWEDVGAGEGERGSSRVESPVAPGHEGDDPRSGVGIPAPAPTIPRVTPEEKRTAWVIGNIVSPTGRVFTVPEWRRATRGFCE